MALKYQRILLKISGEALGGEKGTGCGRLFIGGLPAYVRY